MAEPNQVNEIDPRAQQAFIRGIPKFNLGERFDLHLERFTVLSGLYVGLGNEFLKQALYSSLQNEAFKLVAPEYNPANGPYHGMNFQEYCDRLTDVFEPAAEREAAKIEFEHRSQQRGEHPTLFYRDKLNLFLKGYSRETRDYTYFYNRVIANLLNAEMRNYLRLNIPQNVADTNAFRASIIKIANIVRRKYLDGELTEEQSVGAECFQTNNSYLNPDQRQNANDRVETIHAIPGKNSQIGPCFYCKQYGHLKAQCARKANGLPPTVVNEVNPAPQQDAVEALYANRFQDSRNRRFQPVRPLQHNSQANRGNFRNRKLAKRRVMFVYEQEDGQMFCEPIDAEHHEDEDPHVEQVTDKVQSIAIEDAPAGSADSDYLPSTFLGLGM